MQRTLIMLTALALMSGCTGFDSVNNKSVRAIDEPGDDGIKLTYQVADKDTGASVEKSIPSLYSEFINAKVEAQRAQDDAGKLLNYAKAGIAVSNKACADWFALHNHALERVQQEQGILNVVGDAALAAMGLANAGNNAMGFVALAFGGANSGYEVFNEGYFLTTTIWKLEEGVRVGRKQAAENLKQNVQKSGYGYFDVQADLLAYHASCSRLQLIAYVEKSVELVRYTPDKRETLQFSSEVLKRSGDLYRTGTANDRGIFSRDRLKDLFIIFFKPESEEAGKLLKNSFLASVKKRVDALADDDASKIAFYNDLDQTARLLGFADHVSEEVDWKEQEIARLRDELENLKAEGADGQQPDEGGGDTSGDGEAGDSEPDVVLEASVPSSGQGAAAELRKVEIDKINEKIKALRSSGIAVTSDDGTLPVTLTVKPR